MMATTRLFRPGMLRECWQFRGFIIASVKRDFVSRYLGTQLGFFWAIAQPLAMIVIYTVVFSGIMKPALAGYDSPFAYSIYLCSGIVLWQLFSDLLNRSVGVFVHNAGLLKKVNLPKLALPIVVALSGLANFAILLVLFLAFMLAIGAFPFAAALALVPVIVLVVGFAIGLGVLLGTINVFYRDVEQSTTMLLQFWFWLTPIVYPLSALPAFARGWLAWNPIAPLVGGLQDIFVTDQWPDWSTLVVPTVFASLALLLGASTFQAHAGEIVDEL